MFRDGSAVPRLAAEGPPRLLDGLLAALAHLRDHRQEACLVAGHQADPALADARADAIQALLFSGDAGVLGSACQAHHQVEDWQELCKLAAQKRGWDCDPGEVDGKSGPRSEGAIKALREAIGAPAGGAIAGESDWRALLELVRPDLARRLGLEADAFDALQGSLVWVMAKGTGCAAHWPVERVRLRDYTPTHDERVDVLLFLQDDVPKLACQAHGDDNYLQRSKQIWFWELPD